jgi:hypothetical protein
MLSSAAAMLTLTSEPSAGGQGSTLVSMASSRALSRLLASPSAVLTRCSRAPSSKPITPASVAALALLYGRSGHLCKVGIGQGTQLEDPGTGYQGAVYLEVGVFGSSADQDDGAVFYRGQQGILLGLVPAVHLVHKEYGAPVVQVPVPGGRFYGIPYGLYPGQHGVQGQESVNWWCLQ